jgi:thiamine-phosphate pyrophosphorylase
MAARERAEKIDWSVYVVTDKGAASGRPLPEVVAAAVAGGAGVVQYRDKAAPTREMVETARELCGLCRRAGAVFLVNDRIDVALAVGADGVHLGQDDMPVPLARGLLGGKCLIGVTVHNEEELHRAEEQGADHLSIAPVFATATKVDHQAPKGPEGVAELVRMSRLPAVTIGGVDHTNAAEVMKSGVHGICVVSAVMGARDPEKAVRELLAAVRSGSVE